MATNVLAGPGRLRPRPGFGVTMGLGAAALAVGALSTLQPVAAIAVVVGAAIALVVAADVDALPVFLVFTMFVSSLSLGPGLAIGRLAGPMALVVLALYALERGLNGLRPNALLAIVAVYGLWTLLSVYWATDDSLVYTAMFSYLIAVAYMLTFALLVRRTRQVLAVFATLAVGSLLFGVAAFAAFYTSSASERSAGLVGDPNFFAVYQVLALPPTLVLAARETRNGRRLAYLGVVGVIILSVVSSLSRTGLVALTAVVLATLMLPWRIFFRRAGQKVTYFFMLVAASAVAVAAGSSSLIARAQSILDPGSASGDRGAGRLDLWRAALRGWHEHPWIGLGASNFQARALDLLQNTPGVNTRASYVHAGREVHNAYIEELAGLGVIGLSLFALVMVVAAWYLVLAFRRARLAREALLERFALALLVSLVGFALSAIFLSNQLSRALWILVGMALALDVMTKRLPRARPAPAVATAEPAYDRDVREAPEERISAQRMDDVVAAELRLDRRRAALAEREGELRERIDEFRSLERQRAEIARRVTQDTAAVADLRRSLAAEEGEMRSRLAAAQDQLQEVEEGLRTLEPRSTALEALVADQERLGSELAARERAAEEKEAELARRETELENRLEAELAAVAKERDALDARRSEPEHLAGSAARAEPEVPAPPTSPRIPPSPAPAAPASAPARESGFATRGPALAQSGSSVLRNLDVLEHLVVKYGGEFPGRANEWSYYLVYLRDFGGLQRVVPESFDGLILEVFGDLIARERGRR